jgi:undecaprenyl-diphosphatase
VVAGAIGGVALFVVLAWLVGSGATADFDLSLMTAAPALHGSVGNALAVFVSQGLGTWGLAPATCVLVGWLAWKKRRADALMVALTMLAGLVLMFGLKLMFERPRPTVFAWLDDIDGFSFPSGHTFLNTVFWLLLALVVRRPWAIVLGIVMSIFAGAFRVVCGVHWPSDVMAGWSLGMALVATAALVRGRFARGSGAVALDGSAARPAG